MGIRVTQADDGASADAARGRPSDSSQGVGPLDERTRADLADWLPHLLWALGPDAPGTALAASGPMRVIIAAGAERCTLRVELANAQATTVMAALEPGVLRRDDGVTWEPRVIARGEAVVPPAACREVRIELAVPVSLPPGVYRGQLVAVGVPGQVPLEVTVDGTP